MSKVNAGQASSTLIPKYIGSDFDKVVSVADNIEQVVVVGDSIEDVGTVADNINYVKEVAEDLHGMPVTMYTGETPPVLNPMPEGVMWYCTTDGRTYVWYTDADSGQWVESAPQSAIKDEATNIFFHSTHSNVNPAYRSATLYSAPAPEAEISIAHNALNTPVVQAQFIREEALWVDVSVIGAQGIVTLMGYSSGNSQLKAEIITWKNGAEGTSLGASQWVTLPSQPSVVSLPVTLANIDVLDAGDSYVVKLTSQMNAGGSAVSTILVDGNTNSRFGIIFNTNLIGLNDGIRDGVITSAPTENAVYDALQLKVGKNQLVQSGNLTSTANWANVPAYSDSELGGSDGPLNAQAKALTARSELLLTDVREALRRSYAEAGYNVVGTFQAGFTIANANDVGIDEVTGKGFTGPAGPVAAGTNPTSGGFIDVSMSLLRHGLASQSGASLVSYKVPEADSYTRSVMARLGESMSVADFWVAADADWTNAFNRASIASKESGKICHIPPGDYSVSNSILLWDSQITGTTESGAGQYYASKGSRFVGDSKQVKITKTAVSTQNVNAVFYAKGRRSISVIGVSIFDQTTNSVGYYTGTSAVQLKLNDMFIQTTYLGIWINANAFVGVSMTDIVIEGSSATPVQYGLRIKGGTSYLLDRIHVDKCSQDGFEISGTYPAIGVLSCDNCRGVPYVFDSFYGDVQSLGVEMLDGGSQGPTAFTFRNGGLVSIGEIHLINKNVPSGGFLFDVSGAQVRIENIYLSDASVFNGAFAKLRLSASLDVRYATKYKYDQFQQKISYDTATNTFCSVGGLAGTQYRQSYDIATYHSLALPTEQPTSGNCYRIFGWAGNDVGCAGTLTSLRGRGANSVSTLVMDVAFVAGNNGGTSARAVKKAVSDSAGLASYTQWFQGIVDGRNYFMIKMDTAGTRNLGTFFTGTVIGRDPNLFRVVTDADITNLQAAPVGAVVKTETAN